MTPAEWLGLGALLTAIVGLGLVMLHLSAQRQAMHAQFGNLYIERFWQIDDALLHSVLNDPGTLSRVKDDLRACDAESRSSQRMNGMWSTW